MSVSKISSAILGVGVDDAILGVGVDDTTLDLFESQYPVPAGVSYNSYVILDEKVAVLDTVDARATDAWLENLSQALAGRMPDYLVVSHMEPDHGANIARLASAYPAMQVVGNAKTFVMMDQFFGAQAVAADRRVVVKEGDTLSLGSHTLQFVLAPMVHWPEVMLSYETSEKVLFSAGYGCLAGKLVPGPGRPYAGLPGGLSHGAGPWGQYCPAGSCLPRYAGGGQCQDLRHDGPVLWRTGSGR